MMDFTTETSFQHLFALYSAYKYQITLWCPDIYCWYQTYVVYFVSSLFWLVSKVTCWEKKKHNTTSLPNLFLDQFLTFNWKWPISGLECEWYIIWITLRTLKTSGNNSCYTFDNSPTTKKSWHMQTNLFIDSIQLTMIYIAINIQDQ